MNRAEQSAIMGAYMRSGFGCWRVPGGFLVENYGFRTYREARRDTGVDWSVLPAIYRKEAREYMYQTGRIIA